MSFIVTDLIEERRGLAPLVMDYVNRKKLVSYGIYARFREKLRW